MKEADLIELAGLIATVISAILFSILIIEHSFPLMEYAVTTEQLVDVRVPVGQEVGKFLWTHRSIDLIVQAFVLFGAAAGCLAILRAEKRSEEEKD